MKYLLILVMSCLLLAGAMPAAAHISVQCPEDTDADGVPDIDLPDVVCIHLAAGDGFVKMADGYLQYIFSFSDVTTVPQDQVVAQGMLAAEFSAPTIRVREGQKVYLNLSNVGMIMRPDLFDPHTVHWHGFPNQAVIFDGEPMGSLSINMLATFTYYYEAPDPGTYMYHCHVEATEHMQMGMLGNIYVTPLQDGNLINGFTQFAYNDTDGSTGYDVDYVIQMVAFDSNFHDLHINVQPLPFALLKDNYPMLNGRGYPDTVNPDPLPAPAENGGKESQKVSSLITANQGQKILLRISNLETFGFNTLMVQGIPMRVVGRDAKILRGGSDPAGTDLYYYTNSVTLGGGESVDVILDTSSVTPGTYFMYTRNLNHLSNNKEDFGGMMTEIVVNP